VAERFTVLKRKEKTMSLVDTHKPDPSRYARTADGKIDYAAYVGLTGSVTENGMTFDVRVKESRRRFGHLDLLCTPIAGTGERWVEYKNITLHRDPAVNTGLPMEKPVYIHNPNTNISLF
jgi:hypothetical protein